MKIMLTILTCCLIASSASHACVTVNTSQGTYVVDSSGCVE